MLELKIRWQRPENRLGPSCERRLRTGREIASAVTKLRAALRLRGVFMTCCAPPNATEFGTPQSRPQVNSYCR